MRKVTGMAVAAALLLTGTAVSAAPVWQEVDPCSTLSTTTCWEYVGKTNQGDDTILALVNQLGLGEFDSLARFEYGKGELPVEYTDGYSLVVFKGGQELWAFTSFTDFTGQFRKDVSYTAYYSGGKFPDLDEEDPVSVPEPGTMALMLMGLLGAGLLRKVA